ncbi:MAG: hypothetical protein ACKO37_05095 [Vampirovibrionales bacterium]
MTYSLPHAFFTHSTPENFLVWQLFTQETCAMAGFAYLHSHHRYESQSHKPHSCNTLAHRMP